MRLSFSTRGWGNVPWEELVETAGDMGFSLDEDTSMFDSDTKSSAGANS